MELLPGCLYPGRRKSPVYNQEPELPKACQFLLVDGFETGDSLGQLLVSVQLGIVVRYLRLEDHSELGSVHETIPSRIGDVVELLE